MSYVREALSALCDEVVVGHVGPSTGHRREDGVPFLMGMNIGEGFLKLEHLERITPEFHRAQKKSQLRPGDVVVVRIGKSGLAAKIPDTLGEANCSGLVVIKRPRKITADYLVHFLNSPEGRRQSLDEAKGSTRQTLNTKSIAAAQIPVPPLEDQRRITAILDKATVLLSKRRAAIAQLESFTESVFLNMFGDPAANSKGWPEVPLGSCALKIGSGATPAGGESVYKSTGIALIRSMNVRDGRFLGDGLAFIDEQQAARLDGVVVEADDVLLNITGASVARVCRAPREVLPARVNQHVAIVRLKRDFEPRFLERCLLYPSMKRRLLQLAGAGATREAITKETIERLVVIRPPRSVQDAFAHLVRQRERLEREQRSQQVAVDSLFSSLQHRAFQGAL